MGVSLQIINLQTELNYLDSVNNFQIFSDLTWPHPSTQPPTHPPNYTPIHRWRSLHRFQIFKQNWNIFISSSAIEFWMILGVPPRGWGVVRGCTPPTCTCTCMHARARTCTHVWHHREFPGIPPMGAAICMKLSCLPPCMCVRACACMCMCVGAPPNHPHPPELQGAQHQNSITLELIVIIRFCLKILYLWTFLNSYRTPPPALPPRAEETQITRITITLERIEIIQFCLKIWDPWTLLHTYRLGLMCRWGVSYHKWHFYVFDPKKCSCDPPIKKFPIFALDSIRPYLDWALRGFLTS